MECKYYAVMLDKTGANGGKYELLEKVQVSTKLVTELQFIIIIDT